MSKTPKPIVHARDHEHGGADTIRIVYESVGGTGGGTGIQFDVINTGDWLEIDTTGDNAGTGILLYATSQVNVASDTEILLGTTGTAPVLISSHSGGITLDSHGGNLVLSVDSGGLLILHGLPTSDPGTPGALWRDSSSFVRIS